jgi:hypothetical protein
VQRSPLKPAACLTGPMYTGAAAKRPQERHNRPAGSGPVSSPNMTFDQITGIFHQKFQI